MVLEVTKENKRFYFIKPITLSLLILIGILVFIIAYSNTNFQDSIKMFAFVFLVQFLLYFLPLILFYYNYRKKSKGVKFKVLEKDKFCYVKNGEEIFFNSSDIKKITYYSSIPLKLGNTIWLTWHYYYYVKIYTEKGDFVITCLMIEDDLADLLKSSQVEKKAFHFAHMIPK